MSLIEKVQASFKVTISALTLMLTFYTVVELMLFFSNPSSFKSEKAYQNESWGSVIRSLFINQALLSLFILQHSLLATRQVKDWLSSSRIQVLQRSIYVILTAITLQIIIKYWQDIPEITLWSVNINIRLFWWAFVTLHALVWAVIYVGAICMDVNELLGIKQVYYSIQHLPDPNAYKSQELKRLYAHMRHPSFIGLLIIFWAVPIMSLDRLLLAIIWSTYMYLAWNTNHHDYRYQEQQFSKKFSGLYHGM